MSTGDTIAAIASPAGRSARGAVRFSGPACADALATLMVDPRSLSPWRRGLLSPRLRLQGGELPCLLAAFKAPASYTGEDAAEIQVPGNPALLERLLGALADRSGVRVAEPGEFTLRAFLNGRISVEQGEGVAMAIAAASEEQLAAAKRLLSGDAGSVHRRLADEVATTLALVEAGVDFTDQEDVVPIGPDALLERLADLRRRVESLLGDAPAVQSRDASPVVVLVGPPNAGKSTLFNALLGRRRAVVSPIAGTTRDAVRETLDLSGAGLAPWLLPAVTLVDLAGLDAALSARSPSDAAAQSAARCTIAEADVVVLCDPAGRFEDGAAAPQRAAVLRVRTKADVPGAGRRVGEGTLPVCALDGWNLGPLRRAIADAALGARRGGEMAVVPRHARALSHTLDMLMEASAIVEPSRSARFLAAPEVIANALRGALDAMGEISGRVPPDDVLGRIFAAFCVGK